MRIGELAERSGLTVDTLRYYRREGAVCGFICLAVASTAMVAGWLLDALVGSYEIDIQAQIQAAHSGVPLWLEWGALILLLAVALYRRLKSNC